ncbi:MAG: hypothetical protein R3313_00040 [Candidatus Saccharimonadales bacterium]|nr:hypothetical protein [Candidatus Saccharimonadales bacterium]
MDEHQDIQGEHKAGETFEPDKPKLKVPEPIDLDSSGSLADLESAVGHKGVSGSKAKEKALIQPWLKIALVIMIIAGLIMAGLFYFTDLGETDTSSEDTSQADTAPVIDSYEDCVAAGYPIMESYPEQCAVPDGPSFTRQLTEEELAIQNLPDDWEKVEYGDKSVFLPRSLVQVTGDVAIVSGEGPDYLYQDNEELSLRIYDESTAIIQYSSNSPYLCRFAEASSEWYDFEIVDDARLEFAPEDVNACIDTVEESFRGNIESYKAVGGAAGELRYIVSVTFDYQVHYVFRLTKTLDPDISSEDYDQALTDVQQELDAFIDTFIDLN